MNKKKPILIIILAAVAFIIIYFACSKPIYTFGAKMYLASKYDWSMSDIETIEYHRDGFDSDIGFLGLDATNTIWYYNKKWVFKYNDREFNVERFHMHYADDYQLEDIFKWCTEYLQENYDSEIVGVEVDSNIIYRQPDNSVTYSLPWNYKKVFNFDDAAELLKVQKQINDFVVFYITDDLSKYGKKEKQLILNDYSKTNIVIVSEERFKQNSFGVLGSSQSQNKYSLSDDVDYVFSSNIRQLK